MREILFRGAQVCEGSYFWEYGSVIHSKDGYTDDDEYFIEDLKGHSHAVEAETIGQYTGLKDSKGNKIFEGDICKFKEWANGEMCWIGLVNYQYQSFVLNGPPNKECETSFEIAMSRFTSAEDRIEVIGNIYDNAELMEQ